MTTIHTEYFVSHFSHVKCLSPCIGAASLMKTHHGYEYIASLDTNSTLLTLFHSIPTNSHGQAMTLLQGSWSKLTNSSSHVLYITMHLRFVTFYYLAFIILTLWTNRKLSLVLSRNQKKIQKTHAQIRTFFKFLTKSCQFHDTTKHEIASRAMFW